MTTYSINALPRRLFAVLAAAMLALCLSGCAPHQLPDGKSAEGTRVEVETTEGTFVLALYDDTPLHRDNFLRLVREGYYDGLLFHRVINHFMVQGGDPDSRHAAPDALLGEGGPDYTLPAEIRVPRHFHKRGVLAAAREGDDVNPERRSSASQFYVVWGRRFSKERLDAQERHVQAATGGKVQFTPEMRRAYRRTGGTPHLDGQYTVFGEVVSGLRTISRIRRVATDENDRPLRDVRIVKARIIRK